jgi:hypothetical protein
MLSPHIQCLVLLGPKGKKTLEASGALYLGPLVEVYDAAYGARWSGSTGTSAGGYYLITCTTAMRPLARFFEERNRQRILEQVL